MRAWRHCPDIPVPQVGPDGITRMVVRERAATAPWVEQFYLIGPAVVADKQLVRLETLWAGVNHADETLFTVAARSADQPERDDAGAGQDPANPNSSFWQPDFRRPCIPVGVRGGHLALSDVDRQLGGRFINESRRRRGSWFGSSTVNSSGTRLGLRPWWTWRQ